MTFGVIVGNRGFFPGHLARTGREEILRALAEEGFDAVILGAEDTSYGAVESRDEAKACAALFRANRENIDGVIVTGEHIADAFDDLYYLERASMLQVMAMQTGRSLRIVPQEIAAMTGRQMAGEQHPQRLCTHRRRPRSEGPRYHRAPDGWSCGRPSDDQPQAGDLLG